VFFKRLYVLFFVHPAPRRAVAAACTAEPNSAWVTQQARNLSWTLSDEGINVRVVVHDRDRKFARSFDAVFEAEGARVILTPLMAPRANAHAERWVGSARRECLDWMLIVSPRHLEAVLGEYCAHYNDERPHRSCGLRPPASPSAPIRRPGATITTTRRRARLGGLLSDYSGTPIAA
jgi:putative transposase